VILLKMEREKWFNFFLILIILICFFLLILDKGYINGLITEGTYSSNVSVSKFLSISFSSILSEGILFGDVHFLPATNLNASHNYDGTLNASQYYVLVSHDGNTPIDVCLKANGNLESSEGDVLGLGNETYAYFVNSSNFTNPSLLNETSFTTNYVLAGENLPVGSDNYYRFWLDVPGGQSAGTYNNSIFIKGNEGGLGC